MRQQPGNRDGLSFSQLDGRLHSPRIETLNATATVCGVDDAEFGNDPHADQVTVHNGRRYDERGSETAKRGRCSLSPLDPHDRRDRKL